MLSGDDVYDGTYMSPVTDSSNHVFYINIVPRFQLNSDIDTRMQLNLKLLCLIKIEETRLRLTQLIHAYAAKYRQFLNIFLFLQTIIISLAYAYQWSARVLIFTIMKQ